jgi:hypothetical protein
MGIKWTNFPADTRNEWARRYRAGDSLRLIGQDYDERGDRYSEGVSRRRLRPQVIKNNLLEMGVQIRSGSAAAHQRATREGRSRGAVSPAPGVHARLDALEAKLDALVRLLETDRHLK